MLQPRPQAASLLLDTLVCASSDADARFKTNKGNKSYLKLGDERDWSRQEHLAEASRAKRVPTQHWAVLVRVMFKLRAGVPGG